MIREGRIATVYDRSVFRTGVIFAKFNVDDTHWYIDTGAIIPIVC